MARQPGKKYRSDFERSKRLKLERAQKRAELAALAPPPAPATRRPPKKAKAPASHGVVAPLLAELAHAPAPALSGRQLGGTCPNGHAFDDFDKNCRLCGVLVRRVCGHCEKPYDDGTRYCTGCGRDLPLRAAAPATVDDPQRITNGSPGDRQAIMVAPTSSPAADVYEWQPEDMSMFAFGVDALLVKLREKPLDDKERDKLLKVMAPVANKHYRPGAKYREEVALVITLGSLVVPALGVYLFVLPDRRKRAELEAKEGKPADAVEEKPKREIKANLEAV